MRWRKIRLIHFASSNECRVEFDASFYCNGATIPPRSHFSAHNLFLMPSTMSPTEGLVGAHAATVHARLFTAPCRLMIFAGDHAARQRAMSFDISMRMPSYGSDAGPYGA